MISIKMQRLLLQGIIHNDHSVSDNLIAIQIIISFFPAQLCTFQYLAYKHNQIFWKQKPNQ